MLQSKRKSQLCSDLVSHLLGESGDLRTSVEREEWSEHREDRKRVLFVKVKLMTRRWGTGCEWQKRYSVTLECWEHPFRLYLKLAQR